MPKLNPAHFSDEYEYIGDRQRHRRLKFKPNHQPKRELDEVMEEIAGPGGKESFAFSYDATRHERQWLIQSLEGVYDQHWIDDVLRLIKGGKEANVYLCAGNQTTGLGYLAAKVYRPRMFRSLKNDHLYREGRPDLDADGNLITEDGMLQAMRAKSGYGRELLHKSWIEYEYQTLSSLHAAGGDVPAPLARGENAILMEYIGDADLPAPMLSSLQLEVQEASRLYERVLHNIELMLAQHCVHGDLSAFNILYWDGEIKLIDFPQAINPTQNQSAYHIFRRDVLRVGDYFARQGVNVAGEGFAARLWRRFGYPVRPEVHPGLIDGDDAEDRRYWQRIRSGEAD